MNRRGFAQGSFFCTLVAAVLASSLSKAQDRRSADSLQQAIQQVSLFENIYGGDCGCSEACDASCCEDSCFDDACGCDDCCQTWLTARAGVLFVKRESLGDSHAVVNNNGAGATALSGSDFNFDYEMGGDVSLILGNTCWPAAIEFRYFQIGDWTDRISSTPLTPAAAVMTAPQINGFNIMNYATYKSQLYGFEMNLRKEVSCRLTLLAGFRYVSFDEDMDVMLNTINKFWWGTQNDLYGFQVGAEYVLYDNGCGFRIESVGKAGIYGNDAKASSQVMLYEEFNDSQRGGMDHVAFVGELGLLAAYDLSCCWTVRAGYQVMWLDGVMTAANQVQGTSDEAVTLAYNYTDVIFHGAKVELERRW